MTLTAQCSNCTSWQTAAPMGPGHATASVEGFCTKGRYPDPGQLLCGRYTVSPAFQQAIISSMLKEEGPMAMPVRLVSGRKSVKKMRRNGA